MAISSEMGPRVASVRLPFDHDAGVGLLDHRQGDLAAEDVGGAGVAAALQVHQGVGEGYVVFPDELVVIEDVFLELRAVLGKVVGRPGPRGEYGVHKVWGPAHHAATGPSPAGHHLPPPHQVVGGLGDQERQADGFAGGGRGEGHFLAQRRVVLHIVEGRHRPHPVAQRRVGGDILDLLPVQPHLPGAFLEAGDVFLSCTNWHCSSPPQGGWGCDG